MLRGTAFKMKAEKMFQFIQQFGRLFCVVFSGLASECECEL